MSDSVFPNDAPTIRPAHHMHDSNDILPGARGAQAGAFDYSPDTLNRTPSSAWDESSGLTKTEPLSSENPAGTGHNAFTDNDRPLNVEPTSQGGVAIDGKDDLPEGKAKMMDKIIGKTEKVYGKATKNAELHEKGELRESGGKAAALGQARAPHD